jgi:hypothetical protein
MEIASKIFDGTNSRHHSFPHGLKQSRPWHNPSSTHNKQSAKARSQRTSPHATAIARSYSEAQRTTSNHIWGVICHEAHSGRGWALQTRKYDCGRVRRDDQASRMTQLRCCDLILHAASEIVYDRMYLPTMLSKLVRCSPGKPPHCCFSLPTFCLQRRCQKSIFIIQGWICYTTSTLQRLMPLIHRFSRCLFNHKWCHHWNPR